MNLEPNPYEYSNPVSQEGEFFDRQFVIERLGRALQASRSVQVVGQFRIGKSSLLHYVHQHSPELTGSDRTISIYYDLSRRPRLRDGNDFFARVWQMMSHALVEHGQQRALLPSGADLTDAEEFEDFVERWVEGEGYSLVFLLDEFGLVAADERFRSHFFDALRSTVPYLTFIAAAPRSLSEFAHAEASSSPLWGVLDLVQVNLFDNRKAIIDLIHHPAQRVQLSWPEEAERFIYERGGQHPCYIQMAASALYDTYLWSQGQLDYNQADRIFRETAVEHFRYLWTKTLDDRERPGRKKLLRAALLDVVHGRNIEEGLAESLERRAFIWRDSSTDKWEPLSAWFADWLKRWSTDQRARAEAESAARPPLRTDPALEPEQFVDNRYHILKNVGFTKHSQVVLAWDVELQRMVAIKCLRLGQEANDEARQRLRENLKREGRIIADLKHPNIGAVYGIIQEPPGIVMEWIEGVSLQEILDAGGRIPLTTVIEVGIALAGALDYVHQKQTYHRDIKPSNIVLTISPSPILTPKLIDFDIARAANRETISLREDGSYGYIGTTKYSAPEQFLNPEGVGAETDLFAFGLVLYRLLTGSMPYPLGNLPSLYEDGQFPEPEGLGMPEPLHEILCGLLSEKPAKRSNAMTLREKLTSLSIA